MEIIDEEEEMKTTGLDPRIIKRLSEQEDKDGIEVKTLPVNSILRIQTRNSLYVMTLKEHSKNGIAPVFQLCGGRFMEPVLVYLKGSTFGGSIIQAGYIGVSMHMEFYVESIDKSLVTSRIESFSVDERH